MVETAIIVLISVVLGFALGYMSVKSGVRASWKMQGGVGDVFDKEASGPPIEQTVIGNK